METFSRWSGTQIQNLVENSNVVTQTWDHKHISVTESMTRNRIEKGKSEGNGIIERRARRALSLSLYIYIHIYTFFFVFFSIMVYHRILKIVPFAVQ